jgi:hypothetical protein
MTNDSPLIEDRKRKEIADLWLQASGAKASDAFGYLDEAERHLKAGQVFLVDEMLGLARNAIFKAEKNG